MVRIIQHTSHGEQVESNLNDIVAAQRRIKMLRRHNPFTEYRIEQDRPKVTVTRIADNDPTALHLVRS